jgi:uncharacterized membrane protein (UPF0127 family)
MKLFLAVAAIVLFGCESKPQASITPSEPPKPEPVAKEPPKVETEPVTTPMPDGYQRIYNLKDLQRVELLANGHKIHAWVADDDGKRTEGMMSLTEKDVKDDEGMLFVFPAARPLSFWMQNTVLPLDIIYITPDGKVLNVQQGKPFDETGLPSQGDGQYVLELKKGRAMRFGIKRGTLIKIPASVKAKDAQ